MSKVEIPPPPKRPTNAFFKFRKQVYEDVKDKNPNLKITEITKVIGDMFKSLDEKKKKTLEDQFHKELAVYKEDKAKYDAKYGDLIKKRKKAQKAIVSDTDDESLKKKKNKGKKAEAENTQKAAKKDANTAVDKKNSKADKEKKASKPTEEPKKGNKKK